MHFNRFFSAKANFKVCIEAQKILVAIFPCQSLLLSTIILNDTIILNGKFSVNIHRLYFLCTHIHS